MNKKILKYLIFSLIISVTLNIGHPATPQLIKDRGYGDWIFGPLFAFMSIGFLFGALLWGSLADRFKRKKLLILSFPIIYGTGQLSVGLFESETVVLAARVLSGFGAAAYFVISAPLLSQYASKNFKITAQTLYMAVGALGLGIGYVTGGIIADLLSAQETFLLQGVCIYASVIAAMFLVTGVDKIEQKETYLESLKNGFISIKKEKYILFFASLFPLLMVKVTLNKWVDVYSLNELGIDKVSHAFFVASGGIFTMLFSIIFARKLIKKFSDFKLIKILLGIQASAIFLAVLALSNANTGSLLWVAISLSLIITITYNFANGVALAIINNKFGTRAATMTGVMLIVQQSSSIVASFTAGVINSNHGSLTLFICYGFMSLAAFVMFLPQGRNYKERKGRKIKAVVKTVNRSR